MITLEQVIDQNLLTTHFQPIVDLGRGAIIGYEALTRGPAGTALALPGALFAEAARARAVVRLEERCWASALESAARQAGRRAPHSRIFVNALPSTLLHHDFERWVHGLVERAQLSPAQIVLELSEETRIDDYASFRAAISGYRIAGFGVAVDDAGAGHSGLQMMAEIVPDLIKIDSGLVREVHQHKGRRATVEALLVLARSLAIEVVAEGIETELELETLRDLGVQLGQGFLLARPAARITDEISLGPVLATAGRTAVAVGAFSAESIGRLAVRGAAVDRRADLETAVRAFEAQQLDGVVVVDDGAPVGLLMKSQVYQLLGRAFGRELYLRRPVEQSARRPLVVADTMPLDAVSRLAMAREAQSLYDHVVVTTNGAFSGIVSVQRLLAAITDARVDAARNANPLTGLPGNAMIERELRHRMRDAERVALMHVDLDDFKAFNDVYGFHRGDLAITMTADILLAELGAISGHHFLGHIGGDDFLAIVEADAADDLAERLASEFHRRITSLYDEADLLRGWVAGSSRAGEPEVFPVMTLSVAMAHVEPNDQRHYAELLDELSSAKRRAKQRKRDRKNAGLRLLAT